MDGGILLLGLIYFSFQVYCDFSGYSDIAIGVSKLFGFELMSNFKFPFFARDIREFWQQWHISLSSWFKDYLYMPILIKLRNHGIYGLIFTTFITYIIIGFWHGANHTFIFFGFLHACFFLPIIILKKKPYKTKIFELNDIKNNILEAMLCIKTFFYFSFSTCFFRSETILDSLKYLNRLFLEFSIPSTNRGGLIYVFILVLFDFTMRKNEREVINYSPFNNPIFNKVLNIVVYYSLLILILEFSLKKIDNSFVYFQF